MPDQPLNHVTADARSLADQLGAQTTEALIRAVAGVQQAASAGAALTQEGAESAGGQIGQMRQGIAEGIQTVALPDMSARTAWRVGKFVGRIEGAVRLAAFGVRFWWRRRQRAGQGEHAVKWPRMLMQWGPTTVASAYLATSLWVQLRRRAALS